MQTEKIKIEGNSGTWYVIGDMYDNDYGKVYLLEHETYGDEAPCLIVDEDLNVILEGVWNGFEDLEEYKSGFFDSPEEEYRPSCSNGDYSPSCPWNAPGMSVRDFI